MKAAILVANPFTDNAGFTDPRVDKEAQALLQAGHTVVVLGTGKEGEELPRREERDGLVIIRRPTILQRVYTGWLRRNGRKKRAPEANAQKGERGLTSKWVARLLMARHNLNLWLFYLAIVPVAVRQHADVYVGADLTGLLPAFLAARLTGANLVYDSHELWTERVRSRPYHPWQKAIVAWREKVLARRCDLVIVVSQSVAQILARAIPNHKAPRHFQRSSLHGSDGLGRSSRAAHRRRRLPRRDICRFPGLRQGAAAAR